MSFYPRLCRNETEVESKLIVQYLLPKLGYSLDFWYQEVAFGSIRLDFLVFAVQKELISWERNFPCIVIEAKHPNQHLNNHLNKLRRYLTSLNVQYGLLTNSKDLIILKKIGADTPIIFRCSGEDIESKIEEIKTLVGKDNLIVKSSEIQSQNKTDLQITPNLQAKKHPTMKIIAVYHNKGGVGKTTTVVNLAAALRKKGKRILVIDLDSQANTTFATGLINFDDEEFDDIKDNNILHLLQSEDYFSIEEVVRKSQFSNPEIDVVPSHINLMHHENELNQLDFSRLILIQKLQVVANKYDVVLIDTPPSLNLYSRIALIAADYLIIPSDLKPFANQGLTNVKDFVQKINGFKKSIGKSPLEIVGILATKISTNAKFIQATFKKRVENVERRYQIKVMESVIYERDDLAKCAEKVQIVGDMEIADPISVLDFKPDSPSAQEFELLAIEVIKKVGIIK